MTEPNEVTRRAMESDEPAFRQIGVGPWAVEHPGELRPGGAQFDPVLLDEGDTRNVLDRYRYWTVEAIRDDLDARGRCELEVAVENWTHDFNIGSIVRTANAFAVSRVHIIGPHKWNRKGSLMTELYQHVEYHADVAELVESLSQRDDPPEVIAIDNTPGSVPIETFEFPLKSLLLFGAEGPGLSQKALDVAEQTVYISQFGSVRSLNAGAAAAVAMHAWMVQHCEFPVN
jgi:tRNA G18 (ribose-2'-O)-methylase SpoU